MDETVKTKRGRWMKWALIVSIALNLLVVGAIVGAGIGHRFHGPDGGIRDVGFGPYSTLLSPEDRAELRRAYLADGPGIVALRRAARNDFAELARALRAEPFDPAVVRDVITQQTGRAIGGMENGARLLSDRLAAMTLADRHALADRIEATMARRHRE